MPDNRKGAGSFFYGMTVMIQAMKIWCVFSIKEDNHNRINKALEGIEFYYRLYR